MARRRPTGALGVGHFGRIIKNFRGTPPPTAWTSTANSTRDLIAVFRGSAPRRAVVEYGAVMSAQPDPTPSGAESAQQHRPRLRPEWIVVCATVGILAATAGNVWVAWSQWAVMRGQLNAAKDADKQNLKNVTDVAKDTQAALEISRRQGETLEKHVVVLNRQIAAFEKVEAARLGVSRVDSIVGRDEIKIGIPIDNYGRVPSPTMKVKVLTGKFADIKKPEHDVHMFGGDRAYVPPGSGRFGVTVAVPLSPGDAERLEARTLQMMVAGTLDWDNGFGTRASGGFCFFYAAQTYWDACGVVNYEMLEKLVRSNPIALEGHGFSIIPLRK